MENYIVGIAEMKMRKSSGTIVTHALGSCVGICLYDPIIKFGALIHILLPINLEANKTNKMKYADTAIKETLVQMEAKGARRANITAKIAGGANMFNIARAGSSGSIGSRNVDCVNMMLRKEGIRLLAKEVGGSVARTLTFDVATGMGTITSYGKDTIKF